MAHHILSIFHLSYLQMGDKGWHWSCWAIVYRPASSPTTHSVKMLLSYLLTWWFYLISGGRFGNLFDNDPKQWRLYADFIGSFGRLSFSAFFKEVCACDCLALWYQCYAIFCCSIFDLSTQLYPAFFLPLASVGNLAKVIILVNL